MRFTHGGKIRLCQNLYSTYSRLELSHDEDRPVAIAGIEERLISSFEVRGGFGVLDDGNRGLLWRSLLWQKGPDAPIMHKIKFDTVKSLAAAIIPPPSWSWMAYNGPIDYLDLPLGEVEWEQEDIRSKWSSNAGKSWSYSRDYPTCPLELTVAARVFDLQAAKTSEGALIILDNPGTYEHRTDELELELSLKCVVLGRLRDQLQKSMDTRRHYVLLVTSIPPEGGAALHIYNRVGVGYMPGALIDFGEAKPGQLR